MGPSKVVLLDHEGETTPLDFYKLPTMTLTKLPTKHAPKAANRHNNAGFLQVWNVFHPYTGKEMVANLDKVTKTYKAQVKADRRAAALDRLAGL